MYITSIIDKSKSIMFFITELPPPYKNTICNPKAHVASTIAVFSFYSIHGHKKDILTPIWRSLYNKNVS